MFGVSGIRKSGLLRDSGRPGMGPPRPRTGLGGPIVTGGVAINPDGTVENRTVDPDKQLAEMRRRLADSSAAERQASRDLKCISLPRLFAQAHELLAAGKPLPDDLKYLGGLTQIQYVFVYPEQKDIVIAGPAEAWVDGDSLQPLGVAIDPGFGGAGDEDVFLLRIDEDVLDLGEAAEILEVIGEGFSGGEEFVPPGRRVWGARCT